MLRSDEELLMRSPAFMRVQSLHTPSRVFGNEQGSSTIGSHVGELSYQCTFFGEV